MFSTVFTRLALLTPLLLLTSCTPQADSPPPQEEVSSSEPESAENVAAENNSDSTVEMQSEDKPASSEPQTWKQDSISLTAATWPQVQAEVAKHNGKVVVVDLWSTWCLPCVRELPHLIQLQKDYPDKVVCISVNLNYDGRGEPAKQGPEVLEFLVSKDAQLVNFLSVTPDMKIYETLDLASIPVAFVYDTSGSLAKRFDNEQNEYGDEGFTYEKQIRPLVEELVKGE